MAGSIIAPIAGSAVSGLIGGAGSKKAGKQAEADRGRSEPVIFQPKPFSLDTLFGNSTGGQFTPTEKFSGLNKQAVDLTNHLSDQALGTKPQAFASRFLDSMNRVNDRREAQGFANLESKLFNSSGISTGTQRQVADFRNDIEDRRFQRGVQAEQLGMQAQNSAVNNFLGAQGAVNSLHTAQLNQFNTGFNGVAASNPISLGQRSVGGSNFRAQGTQDFFDGLGGAVGGAVETGINAFQSRDSGSSSGGGGFFNPGAINFGSNPFTSLGFG